jgi:nitrate reductase NapE component
VLDSEYKKIYADLSLLNYALKYGVVVGSIVTAFGFVLWYFKLQRYQDNLIKKEAYKL